MFLFIILEGYSCFVELKLCIATIIKFYKEIRISVNVKTKTIFSMKVTDEHVHDGKAQPELVDNVKKSDRKTTVCKLFADGAYDGNDVFRYLSDNGILPGIKTIKNARIKLKTNHILRNLSIQNRETVCKDGRMAQAMDTDGRRNRVFLTKENV